MTEQRLAEDVAYRRPHQSMTAEDYNRHWLARVKSRCITTSRGCWEWQGFKSPAWGYAMGSYRGRTNSLHRLVYEVLHGVRLRREQYVCHSCDVRHCLNPGHLWLGSNSENQKDSGRKGRHYESRRTHCEHGHEFTPENTHIRPMRKGFARICKECERMRRTFEWYLLRKAKRLLREKSKPNSVASY